MTAQRAAAVVAAVVFWAAAGFLQYSFRIGDADSMRNVAQLKKDINRRAAENRQFAARNAQLRANIAQLNAEDGGGAAVEELARKWLFMIRPDEIYIIPEE